MLKFAIGWVVLGSFVVLLPGFGESVLNIEAANIGWAIIAPTGVGMLIGSFYIQRRSEKINKNHVVNTGFILVSLGILLLTIYPLYSQFFFAREAMVLMTMIIGTGMAVIYIASQTMLHLNSDPKMRGRVFGISLMMTNLAMSLPALVVGGLADLTSPLVALAIVAVVLAIYSVYNYAGRDWSSELGITS
jgi:MFS-type transporter involved in bile tolerance (Atg22 family)